MARHSIVRHLFALALGALVFFPSFLSAQEDCPISVTALSGTAATSKGSLAVGGSLMKGDTVKTGESGTLELNVGGAVMKAGPGSVFFVDVSYCPDPSSRAVRIKLLAGSVWAQGNAAAPKFDIATENFLATVGTSTVLIRTRYLDTMYTVGQQSQEISTRDWKDTVEVQRYTFPFRGHTGTVYALSGNVMVLPWGKRGAMLKQGTQSIYGYEESFISSKPQPIKTEELVFDAAGTYTGK